MSIFIKKKEISRFTEVHNTFIADYLPCSPENAIKIYLYALYVADNDIDISTEAICENLSITESELHIGIDYWETIGLMEIVSRSPIKISFISPDKARPNIKYKKEKYEDFNIDLQLLFPSRMILESEYTAYYDLIETSHIEPQALLLIVNFCVNLKGTSIKQQYILTVAKQWISKGILNVMQVERMLVENSAVNDSVISVLKALKRAEMPSIDSRETYIKWTKAWGFDDDAIIYAASSLSNGTIAKLDALLNEYFNLMVLTKGDMENYKAKKKELFDTAKNVVHRLGLYYSSLDYIVEIYIAKWVNLGYSPASLGIIAHNCFIKETRTLEGMNYEINNNLFASGILDSGVTEFYKKNELQNDFIVNLLKNLRIKRAPTNQDRDLLNTWTEKWGFSPDNIETASLALSEKFTSMPYFSNFLAKALEYKYFSKEDLEKFAKSYTHNNDKFAKKSDATTKDVLRSDIGEVLKTGDINSGDIE